MVSLGNLLHHLTMLLHGLINFEGTLETFMAFHA
jgi:hypothetical protein